MLHLMHHSPDLVSARCLGCRSAGPGGRRALRDRDTRADLGVHHRGCSGCQDVAPGL